MRPPPTPHHKSRGGLQHGGNDWPLSSLAGVWPAGCPSYRGRIQRAGRPHWCVRHEGCKRAPMPHKSTQLQLLSLQLLCMCLVSREPSPGVQVAWTSPGALWARLQCHLGSRERGERERVCRICSKAATRGPRPAARTTTNWLAMLRGPLARHTRRDIKPAETRCGRIREHVG